MNYETKDKLSFIQVQIVQSQATIRVTSAILTTQVLQCKVSTYTTYDEDSRYKYMSYPKGSCETKADTVLKWCTDLQCTQFAKPDLHLNDQFVLQQVITTDGMKYFLTGTEVWYTGNGLNKKATPTQIINTTQGQAIILLKAEIAWRAVTIRVTSTLSTTQTGGRRLLAQTTYDPVTGESDIECIKAEGADECPTCEEEEAANGFANDACSSSQIIAFVLLALLLAFII